MADVFDALLSDRIYRTAWPAEQVLNYIRDHAGRRFDPRIAKLCEEPAVRRSLLAIRGHGSVASDRPRLTVARAVAS